MLGPLYLSGLQYLPFVSKGHHAAADPAWFDCAGSPGSEPCLCHAGKFHGISSLLNLVGLGAAVGHGWWLATRLSIGLA